MHPFTMPGKTELRKENENNPAMNQQGSGLEHNDGEAFQQAKHI